MSVIQRVARWVLLYTFSMATGSIALAQPVPKFSTVVKVYDGDTVTLESGDRVRVRWVNSPERKPAQRYAEEARRHAERLLLHRKVRLQVDPENVRDSYGRIIAGVSVGQTDLSLSLVEQGLAHVFIIPPEPTDVSKLLKAQESARIKRRGIWSTPGFQGKLHITSFHPNAAGDDNQNVNGEYLRICNISAETVDLGEYKFRNARGKVYPLPTVPIPAGHTIKVHSGKGIHQTDPDWQLTAHMGSAGPIWSNEGDRATLLGPDGRKVDEWRSGNMR